MSIIPARSRPRAASRVTTPSARGAAETAAFEPVNRARKPGLARGPSQRSISAASRWSADRSNVHCLSEYFRAMEPCQTAPNASAADIVMVRCNGANSTWALGKRTG